MRNSKTAWRRTLLAFLLIGTVLAQMIAGTGIGKTMQVAAEETEERAGESEAVATEGEAADGFTEVETDIQPLAAADISSGTLDRSDAISNPTAGKWSYIYFGSWPQTEVTGRALTNAIKNASYDINGDAEVGNNVYRRVLVGIWNTDKDCEEYKYLYFKWEPIKWRVLSKEDDGLLVMADTALDNMYYNTQGNNVSYEESMMHKWLIGAVYPEDSQLTSEYRILYYRGLGGAPSDGAFYQITGNGRWQERRINFISAFDMEQRKAILKDENDNMRVFLLTAEDMQNEQYGFTDDASRVINASEYANRKGAYYPGRRSGKPSSRAANCWLRSDTENVVWMDWQGKITKETADSENNVQFRTNHDYACVPAMYISIDSDQWLGEEQMRQQEIASAKQMLEEYKSAGDYRRAERPAWEAAVEDGLATIEQADSVSAVWAALKDALAKIDEIKTDEDYRIEKRGDIEAMDLNPKHNCNANGEEDTTDWNYIYFGSWPKTEVTDEELIEKIRAAENVDGCRIVNGEKYGVFLNKWYKYEPMKWKILQKEENCLFVVADSPVSVSHYTTGNSTNNKNIRNELKWFLSCAFDERERESIVPMEYQEMSWGLPSLEADSVYLLSKAEVTNPEYGFCSDAEKESASRHIDMENPYSSELYYERVRNKPTYIKFYIGWWLWDAVMENDVAYGYKVNIKLSDPKRGGDIEKCQFFPYNEIKNMNENTQAYVLPALRISKDSGYWSFEAESGSRDPAVVEQVIEEAKSELDALYSEEDYSEEAWETASTIIETAKAELADVENTVDITPILEAVKEEMAAIPNLKEQKESAKAELAEYKTDDGDYRTEQQEERAAIREEGNTAIQSARSEADIAAALQNAKERLDGVLRKGEVKLKEWEEAHPGIENLKNPVAAENPEENSAEYSYVYFGSYPQSQVSGAAELTAVRAVMTDMEDGEDAWVQIGSSQRKYRKQGDSYFRWEPIKWRVLEKDVQADRETGSLLLMADNGLDAKKLNESGNAAWKESTLYAWLTKDFYNEAFNLTQQRSLVTITSEACYANEWISLPSSTVLENKAYGFGDRTKELKSRIVSPSDYTAAQTLRGAGAMWWQNTMTNSGNARLVSDTGNASVMNRCDALKLACVPIVRIDMYAEGAYGANPQDVKVGQNVVEEIEERLEWYEEAILDFEGEDLEELQAALAAVREALASGDVEEAKYALADLDMAFQLSTDSVRMQIQVEIRSLETGVNNADYYEAQLEEIAAILDNAVKTVTAASDVETMRITLEETKEALAGVRTREQVDEETETSRESAKETLNAYQTESALAKYDEKDQEEIRSIIEEALLGMEDALYPETVQEALRQAEEKIAAILTKEQKALAETKAQVKKELETYASDEKEALYREAEWKALKEIVRKAMEEIDGAADADAVQRVFNEAKTAVAEVKTDAQLTEEEQNN